MVKGMTIGSFAARAGVGIETIRFYERQGLLPEPRRTAAGYRQYDVSELDRVRFIRTGQALGFTLAEIRELLALHVDSETDCADVRRRVDVKIEAVEHKLRDLRRMKAALATLRRDCSGRGPANECSILDAIASVGSAAGPSYRRTPPADAR